jgi:glucan 1,3-beta-glucosidase
MQLFFKVLVTSGLVAQALAQTYWYETITHQGVAPYNPQGSAYQVFRNVKLFGATGMTYFLYNMKLITDRCIGNGVTDDTAAINAAISSGSRCVMGPPGVGCESSTTSPAVVYFPAGTYLISSSILPYYMTQLIGNPNAMPILKATAGFSGLGLVDADNYGSSNPDYVTTNVFYRQVRNLIFDMTSIAPTVGATGIHWPTAQATSLQNCVFNMSQASGTQHKGVFIENGTVLPVIPPALD